jgi:predicted transcriptional regulator of viral defense system
MAPRSRLSIAKADIIKAIEAEAQKVWTNEQLTLLMRKNAEFWRLAKTQTLIGFIEFLLRDTKLEKVTLAFPRGEITRYIWGQASVFELALTVYPKANLYLSHYSGVYLHGLTEQIPKIVYVNKEQPYESQGSDLQQDRIDLAFRGKVRVSHEMAEFGGYRICVLHGAKANDLGVIEVSIPEAEKVRVTDVERTLIDITVRPVYAGGVFEVLKAFRMAQSAASINKLIAYLKRIGHAYPFHQAIGFYLEKAGVYSESQLELVRRIPMKFDFYLEHGMKNPEYSPKWKIFYPKGM